MNSIELDTIEKVYRGKGGSIVHALKGLSLSVATGEIFGFLGPNGAGKSTTIKILLDLIRPTSGEARIRGINSSLPSARQRAAYLPENPAFYEYLTAEEFLVFVARSFDMGKAGIAQKVEENLRLVSLWDDRGRPIRGYSKGMVQRLGLAQALIHDPDVYILDEPMSGLDPVGRALVKEIMLKLKARGKSIFFSTHITSDVEAVCDRVGVIVSGTLQSVEQVDSILTQGIVGYRLRIRKGDSGEQSEIDVPKEYLAESIAKVRASGAEIMLIEPARKNLESFFLDIVNQQR